MASRGLFYSFSLLVPVAETVFVIPAKGPVAKVQKERFEIATRFFKSLAMT